MKLIELKGNYDAVFSLFVNLTSASTLLESMEANPSRNIGGYETISKKWLRSHAICIMRIPKTIYHYVLQTETYLIQMTIDVCLFAKTFLQHPDHNRLRASYEYPNAPVKHELIRIYIVSIRAHLCSPFPLNQRLVAGGMNVMTAISGSL